MRRCAFFSSICLSATRITSLVLHIPTDVAVVVCHVPWRAGGWGWATMMADNLGAGVSPTSLTSVWVFVRCNALRIRNGPCLSCVEAHEHTHTRLHLTDWRRSSRSSQHVSRTCILPWAKPSKKKKYFQMRGNVKLVIFPEV